MREILLGATILLSYAIVATCATTWYLDPNGGDTSGNGTLAAPFFTINRVMIEALDGDFIVLRPGNYSFPETQTVNVSVSILGSTSNRDDAIISISNPALGPVISVRGPTSVQLQGFTVGFSILLITQLNNNGMELVNVQNVSLTNMRVWFQTSTLIAPLLIAANVSTLSITDSTIQAAFQAVAVENITIRRAFFGKSYALLVPIIDAQFPGSTTARFVMEQSTSVGVINISDSSIEIRNSGFNNPATTIASGGCLQVGRAGTRSIQIDGSSFTGCTSLNDGGAISIQTSSGRVYIRNSIFRSNGCFANGGAITVDNALAELHIDGCTFSENVIAIKLGLDGEIVSAGSAVQSFAAFSNITNSVFQQNYCQQRIVPQNFFGGALFISGGAAVVKNVLFDSNIGGALRQAGQSNNFTVLDCVFFKNIADNYSPFGALGVYQITAHTLISNTTFDSNVFSWNQGASALLILGKDTSVTISESVFFNNSGLDNYPFPSKGAPLHVASPGSVVTINNCQFSRNRAIQGSGAIMVSFGDVFVQGSRSLFADNDVNSPVLQARDIRLDLSGRLTLDLGIPLSNETSFAGNIVVDGNGLGDAPPIISFRPTAYGGSLALWDGARVLHRGRGIFNCSLVKCIFTRRSFQAANSASSYIVGPAGIDMLYLSLSQCEVRFESADSQPRTVVLNRLVTERGGSTISLTRIHLIADGSSRWNYDTYEHTITGDAWSNITHSGSLSINDGTLTLESNTNNVTFPRFVFEGPISMRDSLISITAALVVVRPPATFTWQKTKNPFLGEFDSWMEVFAIDLEGPVLSVLFMEPSELIFNHTLQGPVLHEQVPFIRAVNSSVVKSQVIFRPAKYFWPGYPDFDATYASFSAELTVRTTRGPAVCGDRPQGNHFLCDTTDVYKAWRTVANTFFNPEDKPIYHLTLPVLLPGENRQLQVLANSHIYFGYGSYVYSPECINFGVGTNYYMTVEFNGSLAVLQNVSTSPSSSPPPPISPPIDLMNVTNSSAPNATEPSWVIPLPDRLFQVPDECVESGFRLMLSRRVYTVYFVDVANALTSITGCDYFSYDLHYLTTNITVKCAPPPPLTPPQDAPPPTGDVAATTSPSPVGAIVGAIFGVLAALAIAILIAVVFIRRRAKQGGREGESRRSTLVPSMDAELAEVVKPVEKLAPASMEIAGSIPLADVTIMQELGKGSWGAVSLAVYKGEFVAIKRVAADEEPGEKQLKTLMDEAKMMSSIKAHRNLVKFIGVCSDANSFGLMMEFCPRGSLSNYIRGHDSSASEYELFKFTYGVLEGMIALTTAGLVHRDLAARNVLLDEKLFTKVSDFGSSRQMNQMPGLKIKHDDTLGPIKWQPPEVLKNQAFSEKSDVWSFGCTLLEIVTRREPYSGYTGNILQLMQDVSDGRINPLMHLEKSGGYDSPSWPEWVLPTLRSCFEQDPAKRPSFREIRFQINQKARSHLQSYEAELDEIDSVLSPLHYAAVPAAPSSSSSWTGAQPKTQKNLTEDDPEAMNSSSLLNASSIERLGKLGSGSFGTVYLGKFKGQYVAIKVLNLTSAGGQAVLREAEVMSAISQHRNIVQLFGIVKNSDQIDIVMEFAPKGSCEDYVTSFLSAAAAAAADNRKKTLMIGEALLFKWALGIARGMAHLTSSKVIHRDLSARNVLLDSSLEPKIADFGLGRTVLDPNQESSTQTDVGPLRWFAPECFDLKYSEKTDVWAYGCTLIELATGAAPFPDKSVIEVAVAVRDQGATALDGVPEAKRSAFPSWFLETVQKSLMRDAKDRPTFAELVSFLESKADTIDEIREAEAAIQRRRNKRTGTLVL